MTPYTRPRPAPVRFPLSRRPGIVPDGEEVPFGAIPIGRVALRCRPSAAEFASLQDTLRREVRKLGGTFAGGTRVRYRRGEIHLEATAMFWPGAIPAGDPPA